MSVHRGPARQVQGQAARVLLACLVLLGCAAGAQAAPESLASPAGPVLPAVVTITAAGGSDAAFSDDDNPAAELLRELFGEVLTQPRPRAVATGVILDPRGLVVTAAHAISAAGDVDAITADGVRHDVAVVGIDRKTDLAVLRLAGQGPFPHAVFGDSDAVRVGDMVLAVGSPYGLGATVTAGIVSATARPRPLAVVDDMFQTDAATFPESAGGPLVNGRGEIIGLLTVLNSQDFGISFALPSGIARKVVAQLARDGAVTRGAVGARFQAVTPGLARALKLPEPLGLLVTDLSPRGAASNAGLHRGDVVTTLHGKSLGTAYDVERLLRDSAPAQVMEVTYWRRGQARASRVTLGKDVEDPLPRPFSGRSAAMLRFDVRALTPEIGVVVAHVRPDRPATEAGPRAGDIVREINEQPIRTLEDFARVVDGVKPGDWLALLVQRGRTAVYVAVEARPAEISAAPRDR